MTRQRLILVALQDDSSGLSNVPFQFPFTDNKLHLTSRTILQLHKLIVNKCCSESVQKDKERDKRDEEDDPKKRDTETGGGKGRSEGQLKSERGEKNGMDGRKM